MALLAGSCNNLPHISSPEGTTTTYVEDRGVLVYAPRQPKAQKVVFDTPAESLIHEYDTPLRRFFDSRSHLFGTLRGESGVDLAKVTILQGIVNRLRNREYIRAMIANIIARHPDAIVPRLGSSPSKADRDLHTRHEKILSDALLGALTEADYPYMRDQGIEEVVEEFARDGDSGTSDDRRKERRRIWVRTTQNGLPFRHWAVTNFEDDLRQSLRERSFFHDILDDAIKDHTHLFLRSGSALSPMQAGRGKLVGFVRDHLGAELAKALAEESTSLWSLVIDHIADQADGGNPRHLRGATPTSKLEGDALDAFRNRLRKLLVAQLAAKQKLAPAVTAVLKDEELRASLVPDDGAAAAAPGATPPVTASLRAQLKAELAFEATFDEAVRLSEALETAGTARATAETNRDAAKRTADQTRLDAAAERDALVALGKRYDTDLQALLELHNDLMAAARSLWQAGANQPSVQTSYDNLIAYSGRLSQRLAAIQTSLRTGVWHIASQKPIDAASGAANAEDLLRHWRALRLADAAEEEFRQGLTAYRGAANTALGNGAAAAQLKDSAINQLKPLGDAARARYEGAVTANLANVDQHTRAHADRKADYERADDAHRKALAAFKVAVETTSSRDDALGKQILKAFEGLLSNSTAKASIDADKSRAKLAANLVNELRPSLLESKKISVEHGAFVDAVVELVLQQSVTKRVGALRELLVRIFKGYEDLIASNEPPFEALLQSPGLAFETASLRRQAKSALPSQLRAGIKQESDAAKGDKDYVALAVKAITETLALAKNAVLFGGTTPRSDYIAAFKNDLYHAFVDRLDVIRDTERPVDYDYWWLTFHPKAIPIGDRTIEGQSIIEIGFPEAAVRQQQYHRWWQDHQGRDWESNGAKLQVASDVLTGFRDVLDQSPLKGRFGEERRSVLEALAELTRRGGQYAQVLDYFRARIPRAVTKNATATAGGRSVGSRASQNASETRPVSSSDTFAANINQLLIDHGGMALFDQERIAQRSGDESGEIDPEARARNIIGSLNVARMLRELPSVELTSRDVALMLEVRTMRPYRAMLRAWHKRLPKEQTDVTTYLAGQLGSIREDLARVTDEIVVIKEKEPHQDNRQGSQAQERQIPKLAWQRRSKSENVMPLADFLRESTDYSADLNKRGDSEAVDVFMCMALRDILIRRIASDLDRDLRDMSCSERKRMQCDAATICAFLHSEESTMPAGCGKPCKVRSSQADEVSAALARTEFDLRHIAAAVKAGAENHASLPEKVELFMNAYFSGIGRFSQEEGDKERFLIPFVDSEAIKELTLYLQRKGLTVGSALLAQDDIANRVAKLESGGELARVLAERPGAPILHALIAAYSTLPVQERRARLESWFDGIRHRRGARLSRYIRSPELWIFEKQLDESRCDLRNIVVNMFRSSYPGTPNPRSIQEVFLRSEDNLVAIIYEAFRDLWKDADDLLVIDKPKIMAGRIQRFLDRHDYLTEDVRRELIGALTTRRGIFAWMDALTGNSRAMDQFRAHLLSRHYKGLWRSLGLMSETLQRPVPYGELTKANYREFQNWAKRHTQQGITITDLLPASRDDLVGLSVSEGGVTAQAAAKAEGAATYDVNRLKMARDYLSLLQDAVTKRKGTADTNNSLTDDANNTVATQVDNATNERSLFETVQKSTEALASESYSLGAAARGSVYARAKAAMAFARRQEYLDAAVTAAGRGDNFAKWVVRKNDLRGQFATPDGKTAVAAAHNGYPNGGQPFHLLVKVPHDATFADWTDPHRKYILFHSAYAAKGRKGLYTEGGWLGALLKGLAYVLHPPSVDMLEEFEVGTKYPFLFDAKSRGEQRDLMRTENVLGGRIHLDDSQKIKYSEVRRMIDAEAGFIRTVREAQSADLSRVVGEIENESARMLNQTREFVDGRLRSERERLSQPQQPTEEPAGDGGSEP